MQISEKFLLSRKAQWSLRRELETRMSQTCVGIFLITRVTLIFNDCNLIKMDFLEQRAGLMDCVKAGTLH